MTSLVQVTPIQLRPDLPNWSTVDPIANLILTVIVVVAALAREAYLRDRLRSAATLMLVALALAVVFLFYP